MAKRAERTIVQLVYLDETGDTNYRMRWPAQELAALAPNWQVLNLDARSTERMKYAEEADLLVIYQSHDVDLLPVIARRRAAGRCTLVEYNDNFYEPPPASPVSAAWQSPLIWNTYELFMREADGVITTCDELKTLFSSVTNKPVFVLKNHLPKAPTANFSKWEKVSETINIGMAGSVGHMGDYLALIPDLRQLFSQNRRLKLLTMGNKSLPALVGLPVDRHEHTPWGSMESYYEFLDRVHIGLIPLLDTPYNRCRSDIKAVEIASRSALPIVTALPPYKDYLAATGAPICQTIVEIPHVVSALTQDLTLTRRLAEKGFSYVCNHRVGPTRLERLSLYESFIKGPAKVNKGSKPGYAEREGQLTDKTSEVKFLEKAQEKLQEKNLEAALKIVEEGLASNVYSSSLTLMKLRLLANSAGGLSLNDLSEAKERFSRDIRFSLLELSLARSTEDIEVQLDNLFSVLETSPRAAIKFFGPQICQQLVQLATRNNSLVGKILPYLRYYQHDARLNHTLAEAASNLGMHDCALVLFDWLIQAKEIAGADNSKFLNELDMNYLNTKKSSAESMAATLPLAISSDEMRET
jgi:hypothetical protein